MTVIVFADIQAGKVAKSASEATYYGSQIAAQHGGATVVVAAGEASQEDLSTLGAYGANKVLHAASVTSGDPAQITKAIAAAAEQEGASVVVCAHDYTGKAVAPRVAARLKAGLVSGAVDFPQTADGFVVKKAVFSGKAFAHTKVLTDKKVIALLPNSVSVTKSEGTADVQAFSPEVGEAKVQVKEKREKGGGGIPLPEADLVVSAGRGLKGPENWGMVEELATELGAATACSRPVSDMDWRPHHEHVGQTGLAVRPNLYIAIGISGAIQHLAGVNGSKVIVVINTDAEAPFFKAADYGIVGDAFDVVPKLVEAVKQFKASNN